MEISKDFLSACTELSSRMKDIRDMSEDLNKFIKRAREVLKTSTPFHDLAIVTEARCEIDEKGNLICTIKVRVPEYDKNLKFTVSEKEIAFREGSLVGIKEVRK